MSTSMGSLVSQGDWRAVETLFNEKEFVRRLGLIVDLTNPEQPRGDVRNIESYHLGGIGQEFVNGAVTSGVLDIMLGLTGIPFADMGYFATRNLQIDLTLPVEKDGFYVTARATSRIGKNLFAEATVFNPDGEPRVHATGVVRIGIRGVSK
ncbi:PaaI family thioesterase [Congregibacter sp.]|uniref:PaaI family thioesterase n=1 Tax=Congregibacter sp. TaxID=2744308 RepID=UPI00385AD57F